MNRERGGRGGGSVEERVGPYNKFDGNKKLPDTGQLN